MEVRLGKSTVNPSEAAVLYKEQDVTLKKEEAPSKRYSSLGRFNHHQDTKQTMQLKRFCFFEVVRRLIIHLTDLNHTQIG